MSTTSTGRRGELLAKEYLERIGYSTLVQNFRSGSREIDLVMLDGETVVFVEVKSRFGARFGTPAEAVTPAKQRLLTLAAEAYLVKNQQLDCCARFDVVEAYLKSGEVNHIQNAFDARR